ncbi:MAG: hypothetical protein UU48_C0004G0064 [Candidatus Uhrbacteria bacterium GW2011_GWF2_41_16]|uniref:Uncharacterized protein n=1 Tax=Candidatus Uhrbacteria bacterium GW2011_GWF2_41_16 TaxID=1618997 RepID=A0A0G0VF36_9BACT|nr:MAG: hypothetical protein UT33_C0016G0023 [Candidatus Peregrinibacteria bacterium GW2011_GWC2_39_14]KKR98271.1 MAG: hypothetical protein UU48_C0004G0064 [Candidatus Uhrbacteria bacterium GW2011_GWF2_41_16]
MSILSIFIYKMFKILLKLIKTLSKDIDKNFKIAYNHILFFGKHYIELIGGWNGISFTVPTARH